MDDNSSAGHEAEMNDQSPFSSEVVPPSRRSRSPGVSVSQNKKLQRAAPSNDSEFHYVCTYRRCDLAERFIFFTVFI